MNTQQVYAILRFDAFQGENCPIEDKITVKEIVGSIEHAEAKTKKLNEVNKEKGCHYFWQATRTIMQLL